MDTGKVTAGVRCQYSYTLESAVQKIIAVLLKLVLMPYKVIVVCSVLTCRFFLFPSLLVKG